MLTEVPGCSGGLSAQSKWQVYYHHFTVRVELRNELENATDQVKAYINIVTQMLSLT